MANEFFYEDENGNKTDADMYSDMLENKHASLYSRLDSMNSAIYDLDINITEAKELYNINDNDIKSSLYNEVINDRKKNGLESYDPRNLDHDNQLENNSKDDISDSNLKKTNREMKTSRSNIFLRRSRRKTDL